MDNGMEGTCDDLMKKIFKSKRLMDIFEEYTSTPAETRDKRFKFIEWEDGSIDIVDTEKFEIPPLLEQKLKY